eukprot:s81_g6.t1
MELNGALRYDAQGDALRCGAQHQERASQSFSGRLQAASTGTGRHRPRPLGLDPGIGKARCLGRLLRGL